jgi:hypothetical protein
MCIGQPEEFLNGCAEISPWRGEAVILERRQVITGRTPSDREPFESSTTAGGAGRGRPAGRGALTR